MERNMVIFQKMIGEFPLDLQQQEARLIG